jgi:hypothetical protein
LFFLFHWIPEDSSRSGCDEIQAVATGLEVVDFPQLLCWLYEGYYFKNKAVGPTRQHREEDETSSVDSSVEDSRQSHLEGSSRAIISEIRQKSALLQIKRTIITTNIILSET